MQLLSFLFFPLTTDKSFVITNINNNNNISKKTDSTTRDRWWCCCLHASDKKTFAADGVTRRQSPTHSLFLSLLVTQIFITVDPDIARKRARKEKRKEDVLLLLFFSCQKRRRRRRRRWGKEAVEEMTINLARSPSNDCDAPLDTPRATVLYCNAQW